jgi:hypothetical protein
MPSITTGPFVHEPADEGDFPDTTPTLPDSTSVEADTPLESDAPPVGPDIPWIRLFNGQDLSGWEGPAGFWFVEGGELVGRLPNQKFKKNVNLCTIRRYADFELRWEARLPWGNSGVHVRSVLVDRDTYNVRGPQVELADNHIVPWGSAVTEPPSRSNLLAPIEFVDSHLRRGEFNAMRVRCVGKRFSVWLNDQLIVDALYRPLAIEGIIALQLHRAAPGMEVRFRNIEIRELGPDKTATGSEKKK